MRIAPLPRLSVLLGLVLAPGCTPAEPKATVTTSEPQNHQSSVGENPPKAAEPR